MDELEKKIKEAFIQLSDEQIEHWEKEAAKEEHVFSERYYKKLIESFPFLEKSILQETNQEE